MAIFIYYMTCHKSYSVLIVFNAGASEELMITGYKIYQFYDFLFSSRYILFLFSLLQEYRHSPPFPCFVESCVVFLHVCKATC